MSEQLNRYNNPDVVDYLATRYALGTITLKARERLESLMNSERFPALTQAIRLQQSMLGQLDHMIPEVKPDEQIWAKLQASLPEQKDTANVVPLKAKTSSSWSIKTLMPLAASFMLFALVLAYVIPVQQSQLSYIAVMTDSTDQAALVAASYGDTKELTLDFVNLPPVSEDASYELWVTSKTDKQTRSLGVIEPSQKAFTRELTEAEWRLITDSATLLVTVEEYGGSSIGEPMGEQVAEGICVRLSAWEA